MKQLYTTLVALISVLPAAAQSTLTFAPMATVPDGGRYGMGYAQDHDAFYMLGGGGVNSAFSSEIFRYSVNTNTWSEVFTPASSYQRRWANLAIPNPNVTNGKLYAFNGIGNSGNPIPVLESYALNGSTSAVEPNASPASQAGVAVWDGVIYTFGGLQQNGVLTNQLRAYSLSTAAWTTLAPMPVAKQTYGAAVNGKLYAVGGYDLVANSAQIHAYDIATNQWQLAATLPTTVSNQAMAVQGDWLWMVGDFTNQSYLAAYNTRTGQLRTFSSNLPPRRNAAALVRNNYLYVWGGNTASTNASTLSDMWRANLAGVLASGSAAPAAILSAYPNPSAAGEFTVTLPTGAQAVEVRDALGRVVLTEQVAATNGQCVLRLGSRPAGLYLAQVRTAQGLGAPYKLLRL